MTGAGKQGFRYETCIGCGQVWNVSRKAPQGVVHLPQV